MTLTARALQGTHIFADPPKGRQTAFFPEEKLP